MQNDCFFSPRNKDYSFEVFAPTNNVDLKSYKVALDEAFSNPEVRNIALIGPYGSGKSSVLQTYLSQNKHDKSVKISIAHFKHKESNAPQEQKDEKCKFPLEAKIINHLIQQIDPKKIKLTVLQSKHNYKSQILKWTGILFSTVISLLYILLYSKIKEFVETTNVKFIKEYLAKYTENIFIFSWLLLLISTFFFIYSILKLLNQKHVIRRVNVKGTEIELYSPADGHTIFDEYLDEIAYILTSSKTKIVIFEDIDRFESLDIFERLREINTIINTRYDAKSNEPIKFVYLIKDTLLSSNDRTKFFDIIIPIIPIVDSSNSYAKLTDLLKKYDLVKKFNSQFLKEICLYIDDFRIIKNIINELKIYSEQIPMAGLSYDKLFAILAYKSLFPVDFASLQFNAGYIYNIFAQKNILLGSKKVAVEKEIKDLEPYVNRSNYEIFSSEYEAAIAFLIKTGIHGWHFRDQNEVIATVRSALAGTDLNVFNARCDNIKHKNDQTALRYQQVVSELNELNALCVKDLITQNPSANSYFDELSEKNYKGDITDTFKTIKESQYYPLLKYLIRNGYMDETYRKYMTYFYEESISYNDELFLRSITDQNGKEYNYQLDKPSDVIAQLNILSFEKEEVLNFSLFKELIENKNKNEQYKQYLNTILNQIRNGRKYFFLKEFVDFTKDKETAIKLINTEFPDFFSIIIQNKITPTDFNRKYALYSIYTSDIALLKKINWDGVFKQYIEEDKALFIITEPDTDSIMDAIETLEVKLAEVNSNIDTYLLKAIYETSAYQINTENVKFMMSSFLKYKTKDEIIHANMSLILSSPETPISRYAIENIDSYMGIILKLSNGIIKDNNDAITWVLNNGEINRDKIATYITMLENGSINSTEAIMDHSLLQDIFSQNKATCNEKNIYNYFKRNSYELDEILIGFIENNDTTSLNFNSLSNDETEEIIIALFMALALHNNWTLEKYINLINAFECNLSEAPISLSPDKVLALIKNKKLAINKNTINYIKNMHDELFIDFILSDFNTYLKQQINKEEVRFILSSNRIDDQNKIKVIEACDNELQLSIIGKSYSQTICDYIIECCPDPSDFNDMFSKYSNYPASSKPHIKKQAENLLINNELSQYYDTINHDLAYDILIDNTIEEDEKVSLCIQMITLRKDKSFIISCISLFDRDLTKIFTSNARVYIDISETNTGILTALRQTNMIKEFTPNKNGQKYSIQRVKKLG